MGEDQVAKRLDHFLVVKALVGSLDLICRWVDSGGDLDHNPVVLEIRGRGNKTLSPFKFNIECLKDQAYLDLVKGLWTPFDQNPHGHVVVHFVE